MARQSKARKAAEWLEENPEKTVKQAATKFKVQRGAIYGHRRKLTTHREPHNLPQVIPLSQGEVDGPTGQSVIIIVKTDNPSQLLRSLFQ